MADQKKPFHQAVSDRLLLAPVGINSEFRATKSAEVAAYLTILQESEMPATAAHEIAQTHAELPELLRSVGQHGLAEMADNTLADLRSRQDKPKPEAAAAPIAPALAADPTIQTT